MGRLTRAALALLVVGVIFHFGYACGRGNEGPSVATSTSISVAEFENSSKGLGSALGSPLAGLRGIDTLAPTAVAVTTATVPQPDSVVISTDLDLLRELAVVSSVVPRDSLRLGIRRTYPLSSCDRVTLLPTRAICDRPRLGHLYAFGGVGASLDPRVVTGSPSGARPRAEAGLEWEPHLNASWRVRATVATDGTFTAMALARKRLF